MPRSAADPGESRPGPSGVSPVSMEGLKAPARDAVLMLGTPSSRYSLEPELAPPKEISTALDVSYGLTSFSKCFRSEAPALDAVLMLGTPSSRYSLEPELAPPKEISTALDVSYGLTSFSKCFCLGMTPSALRANASGVFPFIGRFTTS